MIWTSSATAGKSKILRVISDLATWLVVGSQMLVEKRGGFSDGFPSPTMLLHLVVGCYIAR
jgi:hypothetical protein